MMNNKNPGYLKKAWLITWDGTEHALGGREKIISILNSRLGAETVREYVERLYLDSEFTFSERLYYAKDGKKNPYPARFLEIDGVPWLGSISCGSNPWLWARLVENLKVVIDMAGKETLVWDEIHGREIAEIRALSKRLETRNGTISKSSGSSGEL